MNAMTGHEGEFFKTTTRDVCGNEIVLYTYKHEKPEAARNSSAGRVVLLGGIRGREVKK